MRDGRIFFIDHSEWLGPLLKRLYLFSVKSKELVISLIHFSICSHSFHSVGGPKTSGQEQAHRSECMSSWSALLRCVHRMHVTDMCPFFSENAIFPGLQAEVH